MGADLADVWCCTAGTRLLTRQWDDDELCIVYHPLSGDTHLLDLLSAEVLHLMVARVRTFSELQAEIWPDLNIQNSPQATQQLEATLAKLQQMGLINAQRQVR